MQLNDRRLTRSSSDKIVAGVLGGIAKYLSISALWLRIGFAFGALLTAGLFFIGYFLAAILMPDDR